MKMIKRFLSILLLCALLTIPMTSNAFAVEKISNKNDARISAMLDAIDQQNFEKAGITASQAKAYISHFLFDSQFAVFGGGKFQTIPTNRVRYSQKLQTELTLKHC